MINSRVVLPFWRHVFFMHGNWTLWWVYREHWDSLTFAVSFCPCQVNFTLSKNIVCHIQQLYISVNLKLQNKRKPILVKIKWLMKHTIWESSVFLKTVVNFAADFLQQNSRKFAVLCSRLTNSWEIVPSKYQLLSVFQSLCIWHLLWGKKVITTVVWKVH